jgi:2-polyprenyl-6-methoxyphenol hydroxylase-like FAD-dependent oxidoreductase
LRKPDYALDPAGAVHRLSSLTRGKVVLIGDAGGFVSGRTGEGIYPGMLSGAIAAEVIRRALDRRSSDLSEFNRRWRRPLSDYLRALPGGERSESTNSRLELIFSSRQAAAVAGRMFLYGETLSLRTLLRAAL